MAENKFENLEVWQRSREFVLDIYHAFEDNEDFKFCNQIRKAGVSIMNNIAAGFKRAE